MKARAAAPAALEVEGLSVTFPTPVGPARAVDGIDLDLRSGEVLGLVGESGSGKSMTLRALVRLVRPPGRIAGRALWQGRDLLALSEPELREVRGKEIAMIFQEPMTALNPVLTVRAQIDENLKAHTALPRAERRQRAGRLLELVGIPSAAERLDAYPHQFSGGMRQRVMIAIALASEPRLLLADEPTTALDVTIQDQILKLLLALRDRLGMSVILVTHDLGVVAQTCDRVAVMYAGRIMEVAPVGELFGNPRHAYTAGLLDSIPGTGTSRQPLRSIEGTPPMPQNLPRGCAFAPRCGFATAACITARPPLVPVGEGHFSACVHQDRLARSRSERMSETLLEVAGLAKRFPIRRPLLQILQRAPERAVQALNGIDLAVRRGETLGIVGESGCGKSTLARCLVRLIEPDAGSISYAGQDVRRLAGPQRRAFNRRVQLVFQDPYSSLNPRMTVRQTLAEALAVHRLRAPPEIPGRIAELLDLVRLSRDALERYPHEFSGGQRQRIGIARALSVEPECLIADELVSALDVSVQAQVINLLLELQERLHLTVLFVAHDLRLVRHISHRVAVMYLGRIVEIGADRAAVQRTLPPLHAGAARRRTGARPDPPPGARRGAGRTAEPDRDPAGLPVPPALPVRLHALPRRPPRAQAPRRRPARGLSPRQRAADRAR